jgi:hypothetical protein
MAGFMPAIHANTAATEKDVDGRDKPVKPGNDAGGDRLPKDRSHGIPDPSIGR